MVRGAGDTGAVRHRTARERIRNEQDDRGPDASATAAAIRIRLPFIRRSSHDGSFEETDRSPSNGSVWFRRFFTPLG
jgi:hypothetical protein